MATQPPFSFLDSFFAGPAAALQPPPWVVDEVQQRVVLLLNHVLAQEPEALARLTRQKGRVVEARAAAFTLKLAVTPAGLFERAEAAATVDLALTLTDFSPLQLVQTALRGDKPPVRIEGDVQFAAEINWLVDNVRWDLEEDLARVVGDVPAHAIGEAARRLATGLRQMLGATGAAGAPAPGKAPA